MIAVSLACLAEIISVVFCLHYLYGETPRVDIPTICFVAADVIWMNIVYYLPLGQEWSLMMYPVAMLYSGFKFGFKVKPVFINTVLNIAIISILQATIIMLYYILFKISRPTAGDNVIINVLIFLAVIIVLRKCRLKKVSDILQSNDKLMMLSLVVAGVGIALFLMTYKRNEGFITLYYIVLGISIILIAIAVIDIGKHKIKAREAEAELRLHRLYEASFRNLIDDICARQHEFDNHINTIYSQHYMYKTYEELVEAQKKYCREITNENYQNKLLSKGNPVIISFLYWELQEAEKRGVKVSYKIGIRDFEAGVPVYRIVELLGNLLKNAIEEAERRETEEIRLLMIEEEDRITIEVSNESEYIEPRKLQELFRKGYSEKGERRGYGLYNVKKICSDYDIRIYCENQSIEDKNG